MAPGSVNRRFSLTLNLSASPLTSAFAPRPLSSTMSNPSTPRSPLGASSQINTPSTPPQGTKIRKLTKRSTRKQQSPAASADDGRYAERRSAAPTPSPQPSQVFVLHTPSGHSSSSSRDPLISFTQAEQDSGPAMRRPAELDLNRDMDHGSMLSRTASSPSLCSARAMMIPSPYPYLSDERDRGLPAPKPATPDSDTHRASLVPSVADDRASVISGLVVPLSGEDAEERRIAKLTRHLGEPITAALLAGPPAPPPKTPKSGSRRFARPNAMARRLSLDMSTLMSPLLSPERTATMPPSAALSAKSPPGVKRSRSMWTRRGSSPATDVLDQTHSMPGTTPMQPGLPESQWLASAGERLRPLSPPLPERQRVLNVKRAQKMTKVFGSGPPPALFSIKHMDLSSEALLTPLTPRRASIGTFFTDDGQRTPTSEKRGSLLTTVSTEGRRSSTVTIVSLASADARTSRRHSSVHCLPLSPTGPLSPRPAPLDSIRHLATAPLPEPPSPAPFADIHGFAAVFGAEAFDGTPAPAPVPPGPRRGSEPDEIWMRRRRAQKLGQFFGVETREIPSGTLDPAAQAQQQQPAQPVAPPRAPTPAPEMFAIDDEELDVRVDVQLGGSRLWGFRREQPNMRQAMSTLREMRAS